ncbi:MAG: RuBisCO large subunit C-terminal-like domain-containing protein [Candidatus Micrarchaeaceae archaeon]
MKPDNKQFFADINDLDAEKYCVFTYYFETPFDAEDVAAHLCREQSTALWQRVGVDEDFRPIHGAKVIELRKLGKLSKPSLEAPHAKGNSYSKVIAKIAHPHINFGQKIPNLLTAACGEGAFFTPGINSIKLLDIEFPKSYLAGFDGPKIGLEGIRKILSVKDRPIITAVVKPNIGLKPRDFAELAYEAYLGGTDVCKDDEMLADVAYSRTRDRLTAVIEKMHKAEDKTGEKKMFIANITDEIENIHELYDTVVELGGNAVMLNAMTVGLSAARMLAKKGKIPIYSHFDFIAAFTRHPYFGLTTQVVTKLQRLSGFDAIIMPGLGDRMGTTVNEVKENLDLCLKPWANIIKSLPAPGGSDWAGSLPNMYKIFGTIDFSIVLGRGIFGHPMGPEGGARSMRQAWEAIERGISINEYSKTHRELKEAITAFGN